MTNYSFTDIAYLYEQSSTTKISRHRIEYPTLGKFCVSLTGFCSILDELANEEYWLKFLIPLKRLRFGLCAAPFSQEYKHHRISSVVEELRCHLRFCVQLYPDLADQAFVVLSTVADLLSENQDPLLDKLVELTNVEQKVAWVIKESRLISHVEEVIAGLRIPGLCVTHPFQLKGLTCYDQIIVIGPSRWFPDYIFTAVRSNQIHILLYDWIRDEWEPEKAFVDPHESSGLSNEKQKSVEEYKTGDGWGSIDADDLSNIVDKVESVMSSLNNKGRDEYEDVEAICVLLEGDWVVFVEATEGAKALIIDPDEESDDRFSRIFVKDIQPGTFVLVRTSGGGDYIVPMANKFLGSLAQKAREYQNHWKELLRIYVRNRGLFETCIDLIDLGSEIANETNVRNWMSPRSIRTKTSRDFFAIMELVGLKDKKGEYWNMMSHINKAHLKAGFEIRDILLNQVRDLDMEDLQKQGKMDFKLSDDDEGGLTAFRVERVLRERVQVPYSRIGDPFKLEEQLWRE